MPLSLPVYFLGRTYVLHTRVKGRQFKRSLKTADARTAKLRALELMKRLHMAVWSNNPKLSDFNFTDAERRAYELDIQNGLIKAVDEADHKLAMEAMAQWRLNRQMDAIGVIPGGWPKSGQPTADRADRADSADSADAADAADAADEEDGPGQRVAHGWQPRFQHRQYPPCLGRAGC